MCGRIYLVGCYIDSHLAVRSVDEYNPEEDKWKEVGRAGFPFI